MKTKSMYMVAYPNETLTEIVQQNKLAVDYKTARQRSNEHTGSYDVKVTIEKVQEEDNKNWVNMQ